MAIYVWNSARVTINGVNLSNRCRAATLTYNAERIEATAHTDTARVYLGGFKEWTMDFEFNQDHAAANVDATLFPLVGSSTVVVTIRPTTAAVSATNPEYTGTATLLEYSPFTGTLGEAATADVSFVSGGTLTRGTT